MNKFLSDNNNYLLDDMSNLTQRSQTIISVIAQSSLLDDNNKIKSEYIPDLAISNIIVVADIPAMNLLINSVQIGDMIKVLSDPTISELPTIYVYDGNSFINVVQGIDLNGLTNVNLTNLTNNQMLKYNILSNNFENFTFNLNNINNIQITNIQDKDIISYDTSLSKYINIENKLINLKDVNITNALNNQIIKYDSTTSKYINGSIALENLNNIQFNTLSNTQSIAFNASLNKWINVDPYISPLMNNGDMLYYNGSHQRLPISSNGSILRVVSNLPQWQTIQNIDNIIKTTITSPVSSNYLKYDEGTTSWVNSNISIDTTNITNFNISNPQNNNVLTYNSTQSKWINAVGGGTGMTDVMNSPYDIIYRNGSNVTSRLGIGGINQVLRNVNNVLQYTTNFLPVCEYESSIQSIFLCQNIMTTKPPTSFIISTNNATSYSGSGLVLLGNLLRCAGNNNIMIGNSHGNSSTGDNNIIIGQNCMINNSVSTTVENIIFGSTGGRGLGANASQNIGIGRFSYFSLHQNVGCIVLGHRSLVHGALSSYSICVGYDNAQGGLSLGGIAIGYNSQNLSLGGTSSVALGAYANASSNNSIMINATGIALNTTVSGFHASPVRNTTANSNPVYFNSTTNEIFYASGASSQIIKKNIQSLNFNLNDLLLMNPVRYHFKNQSNTDDYNIGFISEQIEEIQSVSSVVHQCCNDIHVGNEKYNNIKCIKYQDLNIYAWKAIKDVYINQIALNNIKNTEIVTLQSSLSNLQNAHDLLQSNHTTLRDEFDSLKSQFIALRAQHYILNNIVMTHLNL